MLKQLIILILGFTSLSANLFQEENLKITNVNNQTATVKKANLKVGQSGVIIHNFNSTNSIILTKARVISSNNETSTIKFISDTILNQDSIANTNLKPQNNDIFISNYMYNISLLIVPNFESYQLIKNKYKNNFINSDLFAGYLKVNETAVPKKDDFIKFTNDNNIATIYLVIASKLYILDALTFKVIKTININIKDKQFQAPFYTNIDEIVISTFDFSSKSKIENYNKYYLKLIGVN